MYILAPAQKASLDIDILTVDHLTEKNGRPRPFTFAHVSFSTSFLAHPLNPSKRPDGPLRCLLRPPVRNDTATDTSGWTPTDEAEGDAAIPDLTVRFCVHSHSPTEKGHSERASPPKRG